MTVNKTYKSDAFEAIHEALWDLHDSGIVNKQTMRKFDLSCLTEIIDYSPEDIKNIRKKEEISQPVFANCLNVSKEIISQWERGIKSPSGTSLKLLSLVDKKGLSAIL